MEAQECIRTRRSVRQFAAQAVTKEEIQQVVELAAWAPSWKNSQTSRWVAVTGALKQKIEQEFVMGFAGNSAIITSAPVLIVQTTVDGRSGFERDGSLSTSKGSHWQSFDAGIAAQTLCLAAHTLGLGTVIMGIFDAEKIAAALGLPEGWRRDAGFPYLAFWYRHRVQHFADVKNQDDIC